ncbi:MAG: hypothetical protein CMN55_00055 [Sneathiella sp.]|jgi:hypothetical protein|nr:hypothetical protein [Sneathiella sp.]|tara:strand:+ start:503 stop:1366 length:864 start_codon:yes stop_codon:yes gene_type:complete
MQYTIQEILYGISNAERYDVREEDGHVISEYKFWWAQLYKEAKRTAKAIRRESIRDGIVPRDDDDVMVQIIVDQWLAESKSYQEHSHPSDDQLCDDMSCMQALAKQQEQYLLDIRRAFASACRRKDTKAMRRIRKLYYQEKSSQLSSIDYTHLDEPTTKEPVYTPEDQSFFDETEQHVRKLEYQDAFVQDPECDPDDSHYVGDTLRMNNGKPRGNIGLLNGLYQQSLPEPAYRTKEARRRLFKTLLESGSIYDIESACGMRGYKKGVLRGYIHMYADPTKDVNRWRS